MGKTEFRKHTNNVFAIMTTPNKQKKTSTKSYESTYESLILNFTGIVKVQTELPHIYGLAFIPLDRWLKKNDKEITKFWKQRSEIDMDFFKHTMVDGRPAYEYEGEGDNSNPVLKEGKTKEEFLAKLKELSQVKIQIFR